MQKRPAFYSRSGTRNLQIRYYDKAGRLVRRSAKTADESEAQRLLDEHLKSVETRKTRIASGNLIDDGFRAFFEWRTLKRPTWKSYQESRNQWLVFCSQSAITTFDHLTKKEVREFIKWRRRRRIVNHSGIRDEVEPRSISNATIRRDLAFLRAVWKLLLEEPDWEDCMPPCPVTRGLVGNLTVTRLRGRSATPEEWQALVDACSADYQRQILTLAVETGLRQQELCRLDWRMVDLNRRRIVLMPELLDDIIEVPRLVPLTERALLILKQVKRHDTAPWVFWRGTGRRFTSMTSWWTGVRRRSGVNQFRFEYIRHTFATNWIEGGGDIISLKKLLGVPSLGAAGRYVHVRLRSNEEE